MDKRVPVAIFGVILFFGLLYIVFDLDPILFFIVESVLIFVLIYYIIERVE